MPRFALVPVLLVLLAVPALCARSTMQWERMHTRAVPTRLLLRLGISHITRFGYTRDGNQKSEPDPTFPPGLTDVVPIDSTHTLLVRGTSAGRGAFRTRMTTQDARMLLPRLHVEASVVNASDSPHPPSPSPVGTGEGEGTSRSIMLLQGGGATSDPRPPAGEGGIPMPGEGVFPATTADEPDAPFTLSVPDGDTSRLYRLDADNAARGAFLFRVQVNLAPAPPELGVGGPLPAPVWSAAHTFTIVPGTPAFWPDAAAFRDSERRRLHLPVPAVPEADRVLRLVVTPIAVVH